MKKKQTMTQATAEIIRKFEEDHPDCTPNAPDDTLVTYARMRKDLAYLLWALEVEAAEYLCQKAGDPDSLLVRMGDSALLLCAATVYGVLANKPEVVPTLEQRETALAELEQSAQSEEKDTTRARLDKKYRQICRDLLRMPERPAKSDEDRIQAIKDGTEAFFRVYEPRTESYEPILTDQARPVYAALAGPVVEALREGNLAVAKYITFSLAPDRDPFLAAEDYWIKASAAALWGSGQAEENSYKARAMMGLVDFYMAFGGCEDVDHEGNIPWPWLGGYMANSFSQGDDRVEYHDWQDMAYLNVMRRLNHYLDFDYVNQFWWRDDYENLGHIWMEKGIL